MQLDQAALPLAVAQRIDELCCEFESSWQNKTPGSIDDLLLCVEAKHRGELLSELLLLEFHYRPLTQPEIAINDYCRRFPEHQERIEQAWRDCCGHSDTSAGKSPTEGTSQTIQGQYAKQTLHRQGGVGRVWIAHDRNLDRQVALKDLQPRFIENPEVRAQFLREAHITGKLEHPNIVPVYQMRHGNDLVDPFYTMRLVEGKTLRELAADYHAKHPDHPHHRRELVQLLNILATVCQTVAYAHSQGVIHRDLKPDNVVVGSYGEIFVLDWGLAKFLQEPDGANPSIGDTTTMENLDTGGLDAETVEHSVIGTPAYMAPEQAAGQIDRIGIATDVYGLGTILFEVLTGQPPHRAQDAQELLHEIQHHPSPVAGDLCRTVPAALNAICSTAMAKAPASRHASPLELRDDIQSWIADEPISCYGEPWWERCGRWVRGHRRLINTAALLMLLTTIGLAIGSHLLNRARQQTQREKETADRALVAAESARDNLKTTTQKAEEDYREARAILQTLSNSINSEESRALNNFKPLQRKLNQRILTFFNYHLAEHGNDPRLRHETANIYLHLSLLAKSLDTLDAAQQHLEKAVELFQQLREEHPEHQSYRQQLITCHDQLAVVLQSQGDLAAAEEQHLIAFQLLQPLATAENASPADIKSLRVSLNNLGNLFMLRGQFAEAETFFQQMLASRQDWSTTPQIPLAAYLNLASIYRRNGDIDRWEHCQLEARKILESCKDQPDKDHIYLDDRVRWYVNQANLESARGR